MHKKENLKLTCKTSN